jgi:hypothetical protein
MEFCLSLVHTGMVNHHPCFLLKGSLSIPNINTISDGGENPNTSTVKQMVESQRAGSVGTGTDRSFADKQAARNHGTGLSEGQDEQFPQSSDVKEYSLAGIL